jgi:hypothetical protein
MLKVALLPMLILPPTFNAWVTLLLCVPHSSEAPSTMVISPVTLSVTTLVVLAYCSMPAVPLVPTVTLAAVMLMPAASR